MFLNAFGCRTLFGTPSAVERFALERCALERFALGRGKKISFSYLYSHLYQ
jgi:hypothetical protein